MPYQKAGKVVTVYLRRALFKQPVASIAIGFGDDSQV